MGEAQGGVGSVSAVCGLAGMEAEVRLGMW